VQTAAVRARRSSLERGCGNPLAGYTPWPRSAVAAIVVTLNPERRPQRRSGRTGNPGRSNNRMNTNCTTIVFSAVISLTAFSATGQARTEMGTEVAQAPTIAVTAINFAVITPPSIAAFPGAADGQFDADSARWSDIKDCTFDMQARFFAGLARLEARVDDQIGRLTARRVALLSSTDLREWDFAMKEMGNARSYLRSVGRELRTANVATWNQQKDKVGQAWVRTQDAYAAVKSSTTS